MAYTLKGNRICDSVKFGKGTCGKPAPHDFPSKTCTLHYCTKHHKEALKKRFGK